MKIQAALAALALWLAPATAFAQAGTADATCTQILANRSSINAPIVHLYGDSRPRGAALGLFEDGDNPLPTDHPLYQFRSPASIANWALEHNNRAERFAYCGPISVTNIQTRIASGVIRSGDFVVLTDAGAYTAGTAAYYNWLWSARLASAVNGVTVIMMTTPEYCFSNNMACQNPSMQYDLVHANGASDAGTLNDAWRRAATQSQSALTASGSALAGKTVLVDLNYQMDVWRNSALSYDGVDVIQSDGIHENVWGVMKMVQNIFGAAGWRSYIADVDPLQDLAEANWQFLAYGSSDPDWTPSRARVYVASTLKAP